jgi:predicted O-methyltransferase YrrM
LQSRWELPGNNLDPPKPCIDLCLSIMELTMRLWNNLRTRLHLLRIALTRRFVYADILQLAQEYGFEISDLAGQVEPFSLVARLAGGGSEPNPSFSRIDPAVFVEEEDYTAGWSSEPSVARCLAGLVVAKRASTVIELGCFIGWTTAHLALALDSLGNGGTVHYVDYETRFLDRTSANLEKLNLSSYARPYQGMSDDSTLVDKLPGEADLIFIDTSHSYDATRREMDLYTPKLGPDGCLALHDSIKAPGVRRAVFDVRDSFLAHTFATERGNGLTLLFPRKPGE